MRALRIAEGYLGPDHTVVAGVLSRLGNVHRKAENYAPSAKFYMRAIAIREHLAGVKNPKLIRILRSYAALLRAMGKDATKTDARIAAIRN